MSGKIVHRELEKDEYEYDQYKQCCTRATHSDAGMIAVLVCLHRMLDVTHATW